MSRAGGCSLVLFWHRMIDKNTVYLFVQADYPQYFHPVVMVERGGILSLILVRRKVYTSMSPLLETGGKSLVYSFEPGKASFKNVLKNHESFEYKDRMIPVNLGTWSEKKTGVFLR